MPALPRAGLLAPGGALNHPEFGRLQICTCRRGQVNQQVRQRLFAMSNLNELRHLVFETFEPRGHVGLSSQQADSLEWAFNQAHLFAQKLDGWLLLQGRYGCGKTHLAAAIANFAVDMGVPTLFITVPDMLDALRFAYQDPSATFEQRFDEIRQSQLLVLDDFGTQNATSWAQEKLFQIINFRYINKMPVVITTNLNLDDIDGRIRSRLQDPELVTRVQILAPDYRNPAGDFGYSELSSLNSQHNDQTFASFDDRRTEKLPADHQRSLDKALQAAIDYARKPAGWIVFLGSPATGKTHLAAAIAHSRADLGESPLFVSVSDFMDYLRATFNPTSPVRFDQRFNEVKTASLLILDGLGNQAVTPWSCEKLLQLIDYRFNAQLPTVFTVNETLEDLNAQEPVIASRMLDRRRCRVYAITAPGYRGDVVLWSDKNR